MISEDQKSLIKKTAYQQLKHYLSIESTDLYINEGQYNHASDNGIDYYDTLFVNIPVSQYDILQKKEQIETVEDSIKQGCNGNNDIGIRFSVVSLNKHSNDPETRCIQLFVSHSTKDKDFVQNLKDALIHYGINCFIAHADIHPAGNWKQILQDNIKNTDIFCAFITNRFRRSKWCDQETGMAKAYDKEIIPVMINMRTKIKKIKKSPHGFLEEKQGIYIDNPNNIEELTKKIILTIYDIDSCKNLFLDNYINRILTVTTIDDAKKHITLLDSFNHIDDKHIKQLHTHFNSNKMLLECKTDYNRIFEQYGLPKID